MSVAINYSNYPRFDVIEYIKKLRNAGVSQEVAEIQGREIENILEVAIGNSKELKAEIKQELHSEELVTKGDLKQQLDVVKLELEVKIANIKSDLIKWILGTGIGAVVALSGVIFTLLKLMFHI